MPITDGFIRHAQQQPDQIAIGLRMPDGSLVECRYGELVATAEQIAERLTAWQQMKPEQACLRVGLLLPNCLEFLEMFLGVAIAGGTVMVLDPTWTSHQIQQVFTDSPPDLLCVEAGLVPLLADCPDHMPVMILNSEQPDLRSDRLIAGFDAVLFASRNFDRSDNGSPVQFPVRAHSGAPLRVGLRSVADCDPFYVGFTSGTTGRPKGVIRSHASWVASFAASQVEFGTSAGDRILVPGSLVHSLSLYAVLEGLNAGATVILLPRFSAKATVDSLQTQAITTLVAVPTLLRTIAKTVIQQQKNCSNLRTVIAGGSKLEPDLRSQLSLAFPTANIIEYFGALELSFITVASSRETVPFGSVGRPFQGVTVSIRQLQGEGEAQPGEVGWIGVKSAMLSSGYLLSTSTSLETTGFRVIDGWATVGDLGWQDASGYLYLVGREQDMVVSGGVNVYPAEVEAVLHSIPAIDQVAVFGLPDDDRGQVLCAAIRWAGDALKRTELLQQLANQLPHHKCPRLFFSVGDFPTTSSGKIRRSALRDRVLAGDPAIRPCW
ncbi:MAG: AMP-binding protein [Elainellaceae cyanobacterium]